MKLRTTLTTRNRLFPFLVFQLINSRYKRLSEGVMLRLLAGNALSLTPYLRPNPWESAVDKNRNKGWALSWPSLLFTDSYAGTQRQTNTQTQARVSQRLASIQQPTFIRDQFKARRLPSPLPFPKFHLQRENSYAAEMCSSERSMNRTHSAESLSVCLINHLYFSSGCALDLPSVDCHYLKLNWPFQM